MPMKSSLWGPLIAFGAVFCSQTAAAPENPIPGDTVITLQRGNCEQGCPIYRVVIFANGDLIWDGRGRVRKIGVALSQIKPEQVEALVESFKSVDYFNLENIYDYHGKGCGSVLPAMPIIITSLSTGGLSKSVMHHRGCVGEVSDKLTAIEDQIDRVANTARWVN